jgi:hypothetical protein
LGDNVVFWLRPAIPGIFDKVQENLLTYPAELCFHLREPIPKLRKPGGIEIDRVRCTGDQAFRGQSPQNDWVWVEVRDESKFGALKGHLPVKVICQFKVCDSHTLYTHRVILVRMLQASPCGGRITEIKGYCEYQLHKGVTHLLWE